MARIRLAASFRLIKYLMFFFNFIFWIFGIIIFSVGIYAATSNQRVLIDDLNTGANLFIIIGLIITITGFLGCCGSVNENPCMLILFFFILFFIFVLLMSAGLWSIAHKEKLNKKIEFFLSKKVGKIDSGTASIEEISTIDKIQNSLVCCGVYSSTDYTKNRPYSCGESYFIASQRNGCHESIKILLKENLNKIIGFAIFVALILLIGMTFSIMLCCAIKETEKLTKT